MHPGLQPGLLLELRLLDELVEQPVARGPEVGRDGSRECLAHQAGALPGRREEGGERGARDRLVADERDGVRRHLLRAATAAAPGERDREQEQESGTVPSVPMSRPECPNRDNRLRDASTGRPVPARGV
jgi:hypothetical protein